MSDTNKRKLERARSLVLEVYGNFVDDDLPDNGNLTNLNNTILRINKGLKYIEEHTETETE